MEVQIKIKLSEKRTIPRRLGEAYSFSAINCSTTKNGEFVFDWFVLCSLFSVLYSLSIMLSVT